MNNSHVIMNYFQLIGGIPWAHKNLAEPAVLQIVLSESVFIIRIA